MADCLETPVRRRSKIGRLDAQNTYRLFIEDVTPYVSRHFTYTVSDNRRSSTVDRSSLCRFDACEPLGSRANFVCRRRPKRRSRFDACRRSRFDACRRRPKRLCRFVALCPLRSQNNLVNPCQHVCIFLIVGGVDMVIYHL